MVKLEIQDAPRYFAVSDKEQVDFSPFHIQKLTGIDELSGHKCWVLYFMIVELESIITLDGYENAIFNHCSHLFKS